MDLDKVRANKYKFFMVGAIGTFMATLDGSIVNVALPTIGDEFGVDIGTVAWVVLAYSLTLISLLLPYGAWVDRKGYLFAYRFGFTLFVLGSAMCAASHHIYVLIAARVLQATGTAMFAAVGPGMVTTVFPREERGKAIGMIVMMVSAGFISGPIVGGYMLSVFPWQALFLINVPIGIVGFILSGRYFRMLDTPSRDHPVPLGSAITLSLGLVLGVFALSLLDDYSIGNVRVWGLLLVSVSLIGVFVYRDTVVVRPLIGRELFRNRVFMASFFAQLMHFSAFSGVLVLIPFYLEKVKEFEPRQVGEFLVIIPILMLVVAPLAGRLSDRIGFRILTSAGMLIMGAGFILLHGLTPGSDSQYIIMCLLVLGLGVGLFSTPNSSAMMGSVTDAQRGVASGILATNRNIGMSVGVAVSTTLFAYFQQANQVLGDEKLIFTSSYERVIEFSLIYVVFGIVFCLVRSNKLRRQDNPIPPATPPAQTG